MRVFDIILDQYETVEDAFDYARGIDWQEVEAIERGQLVHSDYVGSANGVGIYYCYGADHYWFEDEEFITFVYATSFNEAKSIAKQIIDKDEVIVSMKIDQWDIGEEANE